MWVIQSNRSTSRRLKYDLRLLAAAATKARACLGQLLPAEDDGSGVAGDEGQQFAYVFDDIGNRKTTQQGGNSSGQSLRSATYTPNTLNQISSRTVPNAVDIIGNSTAPNTVTVNGANAQNRRGS